MAADKLPFDQRRQAVRQLRDEASAAFAQGDCWYNVLDLLSAIVKSGCLADKKCVDFTLWLAPGRVLISVPKMPHRP